MSSSKFISCFQTFLGRALFLTFLEIDSLRNKVQFTSTRDDITPSSAVIRDCILRVTL